MCCIRACSAPACRRPLQPRGRGQQLTCELIRRICCLQVCGITFEQGVLSTRMPQTPADADLVADPYLLQIVKRPKQRAERKAIAAFKLVTPVDAVSLALSNLQLWSGQSSPHHRGSSCRHSCASVSPSPLCGCGAVGQCTNARRQLLALQATCPGARGVDQVAKR